MTEEQKEHINRLMGDIEDWSKILYGPFDDTKFMAMVSLITARQRLREYVDTLISEASK
jgi:hypothetical protein